MNDQEKIDYLTDHLAYERLMMEYSFRQLQTHLPQLAWNTHFESFVVHARTLYLFLTTGDGTNAHASDFVQSFKVTKTDQTKSVYSRVNPQVLHLGKNRAGATKIASNDLPQFYDFISENFDTFIAALPPTIKSAWNADLIDPIKVAVAPGSSHPAGTSSSAIVIFSAPPSATNTPIVSTTGPSKPST